MVQIHVYFVTTFRYTFLPAGLLLPSWESEAPSIKEERQEIDQNETHVKTSIVFMLRRKTVYRLRVTIGHIASLCVLP